MRVEIAATGVGRDFEAGTCTECFHAAETKTGGSAIPHGRVIWSLSQQLWVIRKVWATNAMWLCSATGSVSLSMKCTSGLPAGLQETSLPVIGRRLRMIPPCSDSARRPVGHQTAAFVVHGRRSAPKQPARPLNLCPWRLGGRGCFATPSGCLPSALRRNHQWHRGHACQSHVPFGARQW